ARSVCSPPSTRARQGRGECEGLAIVDLSKPAEPREISYADLDAQCNALAAGPTARNIGRGHRGCTLPLTRPEYIAALYGPMRAGAVPVPLNIKLPAEALAFIAKDA